MKTALHIALALSFPVAGGSHAQEPPPRAPLFADCGFGFGFQLERGAWLSNEDWRLLLPASSLLRDDLPQRGGDAWGPGVGPRFNQGPGSVGGLGLVTAQASLALHRDKAPGRYDNRLRFGILFGGDERSEGYWSRTESAPYDTLVSLSTGEQFVLDSSWMESYSATHTRSRVLIEGTYIAQRITASRFSWYVGIGLQLGIATDGRAEVSRSVSRYRDRPDGNRDYEYELLGSERFHTGSAACLGAHGLFGIDLRLGNKSPFWSALHLYMEARPAIMASALPGLPASASGAWQSLFGLRVDLR